MAVHRQTGRSWNTPRGQRGTNLVEVMVALAILSIGLLGLAMMQLEGMRHNTDSYLRTQATFLASDIIERMRANSGAAADYALTPPSSAPSTCYSVTTPCSGSAMAAYDLYYWSKMLTDPKKGGLPQAQYSISAVSGTKYVVTLKWLEQIGKKDQTSANANEHNQHASQMVTQSWTVDL